MPILKETLHDQFVGPDRKEVPENYPMFAHAISGPNKYSVVEPYIPGYFSWLWQHSGSTLTNEVMSVAYTGESGVEELIGPFVEKLNAWIDEQSENW
ncbi:hypothetical protein KFU94_57220 [Chloroflexi bacterium TSY]|nr:hypothetical protein [Chloroflexi bacterium TSY]